MSSAPTTDCRPKCSLCGSTSFSELWYAPDSFTEKHGPPNLFVHQGRRVVLCNDCCQTDEAYAYSFTASVRIYDPTLPAGFSFAKLRRIVTPLIEWAKTGVDTTPIPDACITAVKAFTADAFSSFQDKTLRQFEQSMTAFSQRDGYKSVDCLVSMFRDTCERVYQQRSADFLVPLEDTSLGDIKTIMHGGSLQDDQTSDSETDSEASYYSNTDSVQSEESQHMSLMVKAAIQRANRYFDEHSVK